ncbi:sensor histidine kinase [Actinopolyspora saharensis]|uniref:sensor histidine kinase n=1 Tax=Actinopolyspora saharensis TaxID=995062 RepID=UPI003F671A5B
MRAPRTVRGRLTLLLVVVSVVGLTSMGFASVSLLERSLTERVDQRLVEMSRPWEQGRRMPPGPPAEEDGDHGGVPTDFRVLFFDAAGRATEMLGRSGRGDGGPALRSRPSDSSIRTVPDRADGAPWRVRAVTLPDGETIALALSLSGVHATVNRLVVIELAVGGVVLVVLAVAAAVTVRLSLRPLMRIERTADAIAGGELQRRIPDQDSRTETGRLGLALNTMLGRLVDALRQRERSEQRLRRFVADASHELRTPLTSIRGFAELYRRSDRPGEEDVRAMMGRIESEAGRMGGLVEDLILLARLDQERPLDLAEVDLLALVRDVVHDARVRAPDREVVLETPDSPLRVLGDGQRLRQVLTNLTNNALVHTTPGTGVTVTVAHGVASEGALSAAGAEVSAETPLAVVSVADGGPGISPADAEHVFDRFYRGDEERSPGGTGLGLAITAAIAEAHDGRVELHANERGGSTFRLLLPLS